MAPSFLDTRSRSGVRNLQVHLQQARIQHSPEPCPNTGRVVGKVMKDAIIGLVTSNRDCLSDLQGLFDSDPSSFPKAAAEAEATLLATLAGDEEAVRFLIEHEAFDVLPIVTITRKHMADLNEASYPCLELLAQMLPPNASSTRIKFFAHPAFPSVLRGASKTSLTELYLYALRNLITTEIRATLLEAGAAQDAVDDSGLTVAHRAAAWGDEENWNELPPSVQQSGSQKGIEISVKIDGDFHRLKAPVGSTPLTVAKAAKKVASKAGSSEGVKKWLAALERLIPTMGDMPKTAPCTASVSWRAAAPPSKKIKGEHGDLVSDGTFTGRVIMNVTGPGAVWYGVLIRTEAGDLHWLARCWPLPKKMKAKPTAGDIKKVIATLDKRTPIQPLLSQLRVKHSDEGYALLRWEVLAADTQFLHRGSDVQHALTHELLPGPEATMLKAFANCGKGGVIEGTGPGLQRLFGALDGEWLRELVPSLPLEAQAAYAIAFRKRERGDALRPWIIKKIESGWKQSGWSRSDLGTLMGIFEIARGDLPVDKILAKAKAIDLFEWSPLLVDLAKDELLDLIRKPSTKMQFTMSASFLKQRRDETGDSWEDSVEIVNETRKKFPEAKYSHWASLVFAADGPIPDWAVEMIASTNRLKNSHVAALSKAQLASLGDKATKDPEFRMLVSGEEPDVIAAEDIQAPRFAETKEKFTSCLDRTLADAMEHSKSKFESKDDAIKSYQRVRKSVRKYTDAFAEGDGDGLDERLFDMLLPGSYAHLDTPALRSILPDVPTQAIRAMSLEQLELYYSRWSLAFPSQAEFFKSFASEMMIQPPAGVFASLHPA